jgi:hypothetical protein
MRRIALTILATFALTCTVQAANVPVPPTRGQTFETPQDRLARATAPRCRGRSAITGQIVTLDYARAHPMTTVVECRR